VIGLGEGERRGLDERQTADGEIRPHMSKRRDLLGLGALLLLCLVVSALGGLATSTSVGNWYQTLFKPAFNPPDWLFAPVWTTLYVLMAIAAWRVWRAPLSIARTSALRAFGLQLGLNLLWSFLFFGLRSIGLGLAEILLLLGAIILTMIRFGRVDRLAGMLFVPYAFWVAFAAVLNASLWILN